MCVQLASDDAGEQDVLKNIALILACSLALVRASSGGHNHREEAIAGGLLRTDASKRRVAMHNRGDKRRVQARAS